VAWWREGSEGGGVKVVVLGKAIHVDVDEVVDGGATCADEGAVPATGAHRRADDAGAVDG